MKTLTYPHFPRRGSAILVTLAAIVVLTVLLLSFTITARLDRQSTFNYSQGIKAQDLAVSALQEITSGLRQEIDAGSRADANLTVEGIRIFVPLTAQTSQPARWGFAAAAWGAEPDGFLLPPSLVRVSRNAVAYPGGYDTAKCPVNATSNTSTASLSANGRAIPPGRWNRPMFMGRTVPDAFTDNPPQWIYLTRAGSKVCTDAEVASGALKLDLAGANPKGVFGRYAYVIYDEGALLDVNVAGYPASAVGTPQVGGKSFLAYADLSRLPGFSPSVIEGLVAWRNKGGLQSLGDYASLVNAGAGKGFLRALPNDNPMLSRQDLIEYFDEAVGDVAPVPYLTTFSRSLNAPSVVPATPSASNPIIANIRATAAATIQHYRQDGSTEPYQLKKGEPLVQRRFPLARLAWLTENGPATPALVDAIRQCFGLVWDQTALQWNYVETSVTLPAPEVIKTLDQVAAESREPNFFEMLKATIVNGSLGTQPGANPGFNAAGDPNGNEGPTGRYFEVYSSVADAQVFQIGANIIDQADADSFPTRIFCNIFGGARPEDALYNSVFGVENLPYLHRLQQITFATEPGTAGPPVVNGKMGAWLQPELWNPHQAPHPTNTSGARPKEFRIRTYGRSRMMWVQQQSSTLFKTGYGPNLIYSDTSGPSADFNYGCLYFSDDSAASAYREQPQMLTTALVNTALTNAKCLFKPADYPHITDSTNPFAGIYTGEVLYTPKANLNYANGNIKDVKPKTLQSTSTEATFVIECKDAGGNWRPYTQIARFQMTDPNNIAVGSTADGMMIVGGTTPKSFYLHVDPRTDRFSVAEDYPNAANGSFGLNRTIQPDAAKTHSVFKFWPRRNAGFTYSTATTQRQIGSWQENLATTFYADRDGQVRPADGSRRDASGSDGDLTFHGGSTAPRRPVILDRPFRSVGELGYVFRDQPFKSLDFWSAKSADAALLDIFTIEDEGAVTAGQINPSAVSPKVLEAVLAGASKSVLDPVPSVNAEAAALSTAINTFVKAAPLLNRAELVTQLASTIQNALPATMDKANKAYAEAPVRALAPVTNTRTWNLLIDVIAQSGRFSGRAATLDKFSVDGERRYWLHIAIDRYTGKVIDQQLEPVNE